MGSSDLFSSSYGPGVIGTFMALVVLLGFGGLYMMVGDSYLKSGPSIEAVIAENERDIAGLKKGIAASTAQLAEQDLFKKAAFELQRAEINAKQLDERVQNLQLDVESRENAVNRVVADFDDYKARYRESARLSMVDRVFEQLRTGDGTVYRNVTVTSVDPLRMNFRHDNGIGKVSLADLPDDLKEYLQFSEEEAIAHNDSEQNAQVAYGDAVKIAQQEDLVIKLEAQAREQREAIQKAKSLLDRARRAIPAHERVIRDKRMDIASERTKVGVSRAPQMREELRQMEDKLRKTQRAIPDLSRKISDLTSQIGDTERQITEAREKLARLHAGEKG